MEQVLARTRIGFKKEELQKQEGNWNVDAKENAASCT